MYYVRNIFVFILILQMSKRIVSSYIKYGVGLYINKYFNISITIKNI